MEPNFAEKERKIGGRTIIETLYNGIRVFVDKETGYYYAGSICSDCKKRFENLTRDQDYEAYKQAVSSTTQIRVVELEVVFEGMGNGFRSKWIHPLLVHTVCEWADKLYAVKVAMLMNEKAKQALIEKKTLQEQIDRERIHTERLEDEINEAKDNYKQAKKSYKKESKAHEETKAILANIQNSLNEANAKLDVSVQREQQLINEAQQAHAQRDEIQATLQLQTQQLQEAQTTLNQERDANVVFRNNVNQAIVDIKHQVDERFTQASEFINNKLTGLNLTTATTAWLFIVIRRPSLIENLRANHTITANQLVLDTICCKQTEKAKELKRHEYNEVEDEIVLERPCSNALDLSHFMKSRFDPTVAYCLNKPGQCYRKIAYIVGAEENILAQLGNHLASALSVKQEIAESLDGNQLATRDYIDERFNQLEAQQEANHQQQIQAINNVGEEVHEIHEIALTIADRLLERHPNTHAILHRSRYRDYHIEADGSVWCEDTKGGPRYYLDEHDINHGRFR